MKQISQADDRLKKNMGNLEVRRLTPLGRHLAVIAKVLLAGSPTKRSSSWVAADPTISRCAPGGGRGNTGVLDGARSHTRATCAERPYV